MGDAHQRGSMLYLQRRYDLAAAEFRRELQAGNDNPRAHAMLALSLTFAGDPLAALPAARDAVATGPNLPLSHYVLACVLLRQKPPKVPFYRFSNPHRIARKNHRAARLECLEALRLNPHYADALGMTAAIELDFRRFELALEYAERGLRADPTHQLSANMRGRALHALNRFDAARETFRTALAENPLSASTHSNHGWTELYEGRFTTAREHFTEALHLDPQSRHAITGLKRARFFDHVFTRPLGRFHYWMVRRFGLGGAIGSYAYTIVTISNLREFTSESRPAFQLSISIVVLAYVLILLPRPVMRLITRLRHRRARAQSIQGEGPTEFRSWDLPESFKVPDQPR